MFYEFGFLLLFPERFFLRKVIYRKKLKKLLKVQDGLENLANDG